ncbi:MAG TPA: hypothetical protein VG755_37525 [Nannocystaceae bacterium]|nr:hypothetical protein [Nannocystaceae bacterium]
MSPRRTSAVLLFASMLACGDDETEAPGKELGPCVQGQFCESPLQCTNGICVHPDQLGDTGHVSSASSSLSVGEGEGEGGEVGGSDAGEGMPSDDSISAGDGMGDGGGAEIYCTGDSDGCICGHTADYGPLGAACSTSTVGSPGLCCGTDGWPSFGGCSCWTLSCRLLTFGDTCYCGIGSVDTSDGDMAVDVCTPLEAGVCCRDLEGSDCTCWEDLTACPEGYEPTGSCDVSQIACGTEGSTQLGACN